jgi:hypothetical protein
VGTHRESWREWSSTAYGGFRALRGTQIAMWSEGIKGTRSDSLRAAVSSWNSSSSPFTVHHLPLAIRRSRAILDGVLSRRSPPGGYSARVKGRSITENSRLLDS